MTSGSSDDNGWREWSKYVIKELERLSKRDDIQEEKLTNMRIEVKEIQTHIKESGAFWGAIAGLGVAFAAELLIYLIKSFL